MPETPPIITVPVIVDDVKRYPGFPMTRCTYFSIECDVPSAGWTLSLREVRIPFLLVGLSGIVTGPPGRSPHFAKPGDLDTLIDAVEQNESLYIDINDIWLPNACLSEDGHRVGQHSFPSELFDSPQNRARPTVYRVRQHLFQLALRYRQHLLPLSEFVDVALEHRHEVEYAESESAAFSEWSEQQIEMARAHYKEHAGLALKWGQDDLFPEYDHEPLGLGG